MKNLYWILFFLVFVSTSYYLFSSYSNWIVDSCIDTVSADTKLHFADAFMFMKNLDVYGSWYPVSFFYSKLGYYWENHPLALPLQFLFLIPLSQFLAFSKAFYLGFLIFFLLLILAIYVFVAKITNELFAALISISLLLLPYLNKPFSVGGNYPFFVSLPFLFISLALFYNYIKEKEKNSLVIFTLTAMALGYTYLFSLIFLLSFVIFYSILKKHYTIIWLSFIILLSASALNVPVLLNYGSQQSLMGHGTILSIGDRFTNLIDVFKPRLSQFAWLYTSTKSDEGLDTNHGLGVLVLSLIAILYVFLSRKRDALKDETFFFLFIFWAVILIWVVLFTLSPYLSTYDPSERVITLFALSSFIIGAYVLFKEKINLYGFIIFAILLTFVSLILTYISVGEAIFGLILAVVIYLSIKYKTHSLFVKNSDYKHIIFSFVFLFLLFFPLTGMIESSTLNPRANILIHDVFSHILNDNDTFLFIGDFPSEYAISVCSGARTIYSHRHYSLDKQEGIIAEVREAMKNGDYEPLFFIVDKYKVTKIIFNMDLLADKKGVSKEKVKPLIDKYGTPKILNGKAIGLGKRYSLPYLVFFVEQKELPYRIEIVKPTKLIIHKSSEIDELEILLSYNKNWRTTNAKISESQSGLVLLTGTKGKSQLFITFNTLPYIIGLIVSFLSVVGIIVILRKKL